MIKLITTDLDGTLLNNNKDLPLELPIILKKCKDNNIKFFIASGRSYLNVGSKLYNISDNVNFICDNGANIILNNKIVYKSVIDKNLLSSVIDVCESIADIHIILCTANSFYTLPMTDNRVKNEILEYYRQKLVILDNLKEVNDLHSPSDNSAKVLNDKFKNYLSLAISGDHWFDIMNINITKGSAVKFIQNKYDISPEETMSFGDFYNDIEMLKCAKYSFVMDNATDDMKKYGNFIADSNQNDGVVKAINKYIF